MKCEFIIDALEFNIPRFFNEFIIIENQPDVLKN